MTSRICASYPNTTSGIIVIPKRNTSWKLVSAFYTVTTSGTPANRQAALSMFDGAGNQILLIVGSVNITATTSLAATFAPTGATFGSLAATNEVIAIPPDLWVQPQWTVTLALANFQAGDQMNAALVQSEFYEFRPGSKKGRDREPILAQPSGP